MRKSNAEYQRQYRERKKAALNDVVTPLDVTVEGTGLVESVELPIKASRKHPAKIVNDEADAPLFPKTDRESGLPRSNYYPTKPGERTWTETIQKMDPHLAQKILDRIAPPRKMR